MRAKVSSSTLPRNADLAGVVSQRALRELYLEPFRVAVREAEPWAIMSSYNRINGTHVSERRDLLTDVLRGEW